LIKAQSAQKLLEVCGHAATDATMFLLDEKPLSARVPPKSAGGQAFRLAGSSAGIRGIDCASDHSWLH
jgi:hypothetical protein